MKIHYHVETDSLYIELRPEPSRETREIVPGVNADFSDDGALIGLDIDRASHKLDLSSIEAIALPLVSLKAA